jgi:hypothetical protein
MWRIIFMCAALLFWSRSEAQNFYVVPPSTLGMNLSAAQEEMPFLNIMKGTNGWYTENSSSSDTEEETALYTNFIDSNQYPTSLMTGGPCPNGPCPSHTFTQVSAYIFPVYPPGNYVILFTGAQNTATAGTVVVSLNGTSPVTCTSGRCIFPTGAGTTKIRVTLTATDPTSIGNYINQIALVYSPDSTSGNVGVNETSFLAGNCLTTMNAYCISPLWVARMSAFKTFRMMNWGNTLSNLNVNWTDRALPTWAFWATSNVNDVRPAALQNGFPVEAMVAACNANNADCWVNLPCLSTQTYVQNEAGLVASTLISNLKAYTEYCNEVWNSGALSAAIQSGMATLGMAAYPSGATCPSNQGGPLSNNFSYMFAYGILEAVLDGQQFKSALGASRVIAEMGSQFDFGSGNRIAYQANWQASNCGGNGSLFAGTAAANVNNIALAPYLPSGGFQIAPLAWTADADGGLTKFFTELTTGGVLPTAVVTGNCGNGAGKTCDSGGTSAFTLTSGLSLSDPPPNGTCLGVTFNAANGTAPTLAVDGGTAYPMVTRFGVALGSGAQGANSVTAFCFTNQTSAGSVTPSWYLQPLGYTNGVHGGWTNQVLDVWVCDAAVLAGSPGCSTNFSSTPVGMNAYESGQNFVAGSNTPYENFYYAAMRDNRMGSAYTAYYNGLRTSTTGLINVFSNILQFSAFGTWGVLEGINSTTSPRYEASKNFHNYLLNRDLHRGAPANDNDDTPVGLNKAA